MNIVETRDLGRRYGAHLGVAGVLAHHPRWPPDGARRTQRRRQDHPAELVMGLTTPSAGELTVLGGLRPGSLPALDGIGFVAQDTPVYRGFSVGDMVHLSTNLNRSFDSAFARRRLGDLGIDQRKRAGSLSGGQRAQLALTLALARRPRLLVLDEPTAALDPLARHDFMATVMAAMADDGVSVVLSSHLLAELERVADHLVLMSGGRVRLDGPVDDLLAAHRLVTIRSGPVSKNPGWEVVESHVAGAQTQQLIRLGSPESHLRGGCDAVVGRDRGARHDLSPHQLAPCTCPRRSPPMTALLSSRSWTISPVPLRRLGWVAWRRNRATVLGLAGLLATLATYLLITGLQTRVAYNDLGSCIPPISTDACRIQWTSFVDSHGDRGLMGPLLVVLPGIMGAVIGAPLLGRELESGVFRYSWTQGAGRMRWAAAVIIPVTIVSTVLMSALGVLITWRNEPMVVAGSAQRLDTSTFPTTGLAVVGWTLLALSAGVLAGLLWGRVVPAMATTFAAWFGLAYLASVLRPHLLTPLTTTGDVPVGGLEISEHWTKGGRPVGLAEVSSVLEKVGVSMSDDGFSAQAHKGSAAPPDPITYLSEHGYAHVHSYQPDSRYWTFQWIELGWLIFVSVALLGVTFWLVRRRSA